MHELLWLLAAVWFLVGVVAIWKLFLTKRESQEKLPYKAKQYFFSRSEREFFRVLIESLDQDRYSIFPKVRLADFVEVTASGSEYYRWWNKIKSKHVDFLVWDMKVEKLVLAIELDGRSHQKGKTKERDEFVETVYRNLDLPLERVIVGSDFNEAAKTLNKNHF